MKKQISRVLAIILTGVLLLSGLTAATPQAIASTTGTWEFLGSSDGLADDLVTWVSAPSLNVQDGIPTIGYTDPTDNGNGLKNMLKKYDGTSWITENTYRQPTGWNNAGYMATELFFDHGTPYIAMFNGAYLPKILKYNGSDWEEVTTPVTNVAAFGISMFIDNGTPYISFIDALNSETGEPDENFTTPKVMKYVDNAWEEVGDSTGFSANLETDLSLYVSDGIPYLAYSDLENDSKVTVKMYNGSSWVTVGVSGLSVGKANGLTLIVDNGTPYLSFHDVYNSSKAIVMRFDGSSWVTLGGSAGTTADTGLMPALFIDNGTPYMAYGNDNYSVTVMKYEAGSWVTLASELADSMYPALYVENGILYLTYMRGAIIGDFVERVFVKKFTLTPPSLTADTTSSDTASEIEITFPDDAEWRGAITAIKDGTAIVAEADYTISTGKITFHAGALTEGSHTITVEARGYSDTAVSQAVAAAVEIIKMISAAPTAPTNKPVKVTIAYSSTAKVKEYKLNSTNKWVKYTSPITLSKNDTVMAREKDAQGNITNEDSLVISNIDKVAPVVPTLAADVTTATYQAVIVTISYPSDAAVKEYKVAPSTTWTAYTEPVSVSANVKVSARVKDAAGNISKEASLTLKNIDKIAPKKATIAAKILVPTNLDVNVKITYPKDGVVKEYKVGEDGTWTAYTVPLSITSNSTVFARSTDAAGNISIETTYAIKITPKYFLTP